MIKKLKNRLRRWAIHKLGGFAGPVCIIEISEEDLEKCKQEAIQIFKDEFTKEDINV